MKGNAPRGFKEIPLTDGNYFASRSGKIFSIGRSKTPGGIIKTGLTGRGYPQVSIWFDGKRRNKTVHKLVALTHLPNPENHKQVNHKNGKKADNRASNLEWCNSFYNVGHSFEVLNRIGPNRKLNRVQIIEILAYKHTAKSLMKRFKISRDTIEKIRTHRHYKKPNTWKKK